MSDAERSEQSDAVSDAERSEQSDAVSDVERSEGVQESSATGAERSRRRGGAAREPRTTGQLARIWDWMLRIVIGVIVVIVLINAVGPTVRYWFSAQRHVVDTLGTSSLYLGAGAEPVDAAAIAGIVGTRPLAIVSLAPSDPLARDALGTCQGVVEHLPTLIVTVIVDGASGAGCEGKDVEFGPGVDSLGWDYVFWQTQSGADSLLVGDVPAITRQLALAYDAEVKGGRLVAAERHFSNPSGRWLPALLQAIGIVAAGLVAFFLLRLGSRRYLDAMERRRAFGAERDLIDGELGTIAVLIVGVEPDDRGRADLTRTLGAVSEDYRQALDDLDASQPGTDLSELRDRVSRIRQRLESAATAHA